jgi:hypothetical protein
VIIHLTEAARALGIELLVYFTGIRMSLGAAVIEAAQQ